MQAYKSKLSQESVDISVGKVGRGEAGGIRWWHYKWDEKRAERRIKGGLLDSLVDLGPASDSSSRSNSTEGTLPAIHLAWDGMVIDFQQH